MTRPVFAGIDVSSTAVDVVLLDLQTDAATWHRRPLGKGRRGEDAFDRVRTMRDVLPARTGWKAANVALIAIERPVGNTLRGGIPLAWAYGALLACLPTDPALPVIALEPWTWKKWSLGGGFPGHGNAKKDAVAAWARREWPNPPASVPQDALDAYAIARAARALCDHYSPTPGGRLPTPDELQRELRKDRSK